MNRNIAQTVLKNADAYLAFIETREEDGKVIVVTSLRSENMTKNLMQPSFLALLNNIYDYYKLDRLICSKIAA